MMRTRRTSITILALALGIVPLAGCGSSKKKAPDTTAVAAATESTAATETTGATDTTTADATETTTGATDTTTAAGTETTAAATETTASAAAAPDAVTAVLTGSGITDATQVDCVVKGAGDVTVEPGKVPGPLLRSIYRCAPEQFGARYIPSTAGVLKGAEPSFTDAQATCVATVIYTEMGKLSDDDLTTALSTGQPKPAPLKEAIIKGAPACNVTDAQLAKIAS